MDQRLQIVPRNQEIIHS
jgi:hypothetical protein